MPWARSSRRRNTRIWRGRSTCSGRSRGFCTGLRRSSAESATGEVRNCWTSCWRTHSKETEAMGSAQVHEIRQTPPPIADGKSEEPVLNQADLVYDDIITKYANQQRFAW